MPRHAPSLRRALILLLGSSTLALPLFLAPAHAQSMLPAAADVRVDASGSTSADASLALLNHQDSGTASIAAQEDTSAVVQMIYGDTDGAIIAAHDNGQLASAVANDASNLLDPGTSRAPANAGLANIQSGNGQISVSLGDRESGHVAGVTVSPQGHLTDSRISVADNAVTGAAMGNRADNRIPADAAMLIGSGVATAGSLGSDHGALGTLALVNSQKLGAPGSDGAPIAAVSSEVASRFGVDGDFDAPGSNISVTDNQQKSLAVANTAASTVEAGSTAGSVALSSDQYGQARILATSDMKLAGKATGDGIATTISGNADTALAVMNDAANAITGTGTAAGVTASGAAAGFAPPIASGQSALASQQFATGSVTASAASRAFPSDIDGDMVASRFSVTENAVSAEASANRAGNQVAAAASAALVNSQGNLARVAAVAVMAEPASFRSVDEGSAIVLDSNSAQSIARGNAADNAMTITGNAVPDGPADAETGSEGAMAMGAAVLVNNQVNAAGITATSSASPPLNLGTVAGATFASTGNSLTAAAVGNMADNSITAPANGAALASSQVNTGAVIATVTGGALAAGDVRSGILTFSGNQLGATAIGNQVVNLVTTGR